MGPLLRAVNAVAEAIEGEFPDVAISTMAYQHTSKPPRLVKPRANVIVRLCVGYNQSFSITSNVHFQQELATWQNISSRVYLWDYRANFNDLGFLSPYAFWASIVPNMKAFKASGIKGYFAESDMTNLHVSGDCRFVVKTCLPRIERHVVGCSFRVVAGGLAGARDVPHDHDGLGF